MSCNLVIVRQESKNTDSDIVKTEFEGIFLDIRGSFRWNILIF